MSGTLDTVVVRLGKMQLLIKFQVILLIEG